MSKRAQPEVGNGTARVVVVARHFIEEFLEYVTKKQENLSFIGTGRLLQALPELCSALRTCTLAPKLLKQEDVSPRCSDGCC